MRTAANMISCITAVALVSTESATLQVIGLALLFMAAFNLGWRSAEAESHNQ